MKIIDAVPYNPETKCIEVLPEAVVDLFRTGAAVPDIIRVQYQFGMKRFYKTDAMGELLKDKKTGKRILDTEKSYPVLTTVLTFADNTTSVVLNSQADGLQLDNDGQPTELAKEIGLLYAFAKRIMAGKLKITDDGLKIEYAGFGNKLRKLVQSAAPAAEKHESAENVKKAVAKHSKQPKKANAVKKA